MYADVDEEKDDDSIRLDPVCPVRNGGPAQFQATTTGISNGVDFWEFLAKARPGKGRQQSRRRIKGCDVEGPFCRGYRKSD